MIEMRTGLPGSGKGRSVVGEIERRLRQTNRLIVTTMTEIDLDMLSAYMLRKYPNLRIDLHKRLFFMPKTQTTTFFRFRGLVTLDMPPKLHKDESVEEKDAKLQAYFAQVAERNLPGVDYILTEAHRHFRSETWSSISEAVLFYTTQHRHLDDNLMLETQLPKLVVVQMRDLCEVCVVMQNHYRQSWGWFGKPGRFVAQHYYGVPKSPTAEPFQKTWFTLDKDGLAACYSTRGALGRTDLPPETKPDRRVLPWWSFLIIVGVVVTLIIALIWKSPKVLEWGVGKLFSAAQGAVPGLAAVASPGTVDKSPQIERTAGSSPALASGTAPSESPREPVRVVAALWGDGKGKFVLSNGEVYTDRGPGARAVRYDPISRVLTLSDGRAYYSK